MRRRDAAALLSGAALLWGAASVSSEPPSFSVSPGRGTPPATIIVTGDGLEPGARVALHGGGPFLAGSFTLPEGARSLQVRGHRVFVAFYSHASKLGGIQAIDVSDPEQPVRTGGFETGDSGIGVEMRDQLAYIAFMNPYTFLGGLHVVDLDHPGGALRLGSFYTFFDPQALVLDGRHVYVADGVSGLRIVDVADPAFPIESATLPSQGTAHDVALAPGVAYLADGAGGLRIVDVTDPGMPRAIGAWAPPGADILSVALDGTTVFVSDLKRGLLALDVSDAERPALLAEMPLPDAANGLAFHEHRLYAAAGAAGLQIVDATDPRRLRVIGSRGVDGNSGYFFDVAVAAGRAYVADLLNGVQVIDVGLTAPEALAGGADRPGLTLAVAADERLASTAGDGGVSFFAITPEGVPVEAGRLATPAAFGVSLSGGRAWVAAGTEGLVVVDPQDPQHPSIVASADTDGEAQAVALADGRAFVADGSRGLAIFDAADPTALSRLGGLDTIGTARGVAVAGPLVYIADDFRGLVVVDAADPSAPVQRARFDTPGRAWGVAVSGGYAYVADLNRGLQVVDVTQPSAPRLARTIGTPGAASAVAISGTRLLVADGFAGLLEFDLSRPDAPVLTGVYDTPGVATAVAPGGSDGAPALVADGPRGLRAVRLNPPLPPAVPDAGGAALRQEIPAGFVPGPYDVQVLSAEGIPLGEPVRNGFVVCGAADLRAGLAPSRLASAVGPTPSPWMLRLDGDARWFDPEPRHEARLLLPPVGATPSFRFDAGREAIAITLAADGAATVTLSGPDRAAMQAVWSAVTAAGGFPLPRLDARAYGPLRLGVHPGPGTSGPRRWRYELQAGTLSRADAWGPGAGLDFEVTGADPLGCGARVVESM